jgi:hypothetical protein
VAPPFLRVHTSRSDSANPSARPRRPVAMATDASTQPIRPRVSRGGGSVGRPRVVPVRRPVEDRERSGDRARGSRRAGVVGGCSAYRIGYAVGRPDRAISVVNCEFARSLRCRHAAVGVAHRDGYVSARAGRYPCAVRSASHLSLRCGRLRYVAIFEVKSDQAPRELPDFEGSEGLRRLDDISISPEIRNAPPASRIRLCATPPRALRVLRGQDCSETVGGTVPTAGGTRCSRSSRG